MPLISIIVPTYNERENVRPLYERIAQVLEDFELIFVDDGSPDGTAEVVEGLMACDRRVKLRQRGAKLGLGSAVLHGLEIASGEFVVMMDADLSHSPSDIPRMLSAAEAADIVIGSRYIPGGRIEGWSLQRRLLSRAAIGLCRLLLKLRVKDATSGYALFRRAFLEGIKEKLSPRGYKLLLEILVKAPEARICEVPITFTERMYGRSKMDLTEMLRFLQLCLELRKLTPGGRDRGLA